MSNSGRSQDAAAQVPSDSEPTICDRIRALITSGELPLGSRIYDKQLAGDMEVSRTPVREALLQLQNEGLVAIKPQSGTFVFRPTRTDIHEIFVTRAILETGAIRCGLAENAADTFASLGLLVSQAALALEVRDFSLCDELDWSFHEGLVASTGNKYLIKAYEGISAQLRAMRHRMPSNPERIGNAIDQHRRILDLLMTKRIDDAVNQMNAHISNAENLLAGPADTSSQVR